jgi:hypothetical protein
MKIEARFPAAESLAGLMLLLAHQSSGADWMDLRCGPTAARVAQAELKAIGWPIREDITLRGWIWFFGIDENDEEADREIDLDCVDYINAHGRDWLAKARAAHGRNDA